MIANACLPNLPTGKTTTINMLSGMLPVSSGSACFRDLGCAVETRGHQPSRDPLHPVLPEAKGQGLPDTVSSVSQFHMYDAAATP